MSTHDDDVDHLHREQVRRGDPDAFAALFDLHGRAVLGHAHRLTGEASLAEDVLSETFLTAWRHRADVRPDEGSLLPWLLGIATHQSRNATRGRRRRRAFLDRRPAPAPVEDIADAAATRVDDARHLRSVQQALRLLTRAELEVIGLCVWSSLSYAEAAEALDVPVGTVRSRLSRARARLRAATDRQLAADAAARADPPRPPGPPGPPQSARTLSTPRPRTETR